MTAGLLHGDGCTVESTGLILKRFGISTRDHVACPAVQNRSGKLKMRTHHKSRGVVARPQRTVRANRVLRPMAGQCFEIDIRREGGRWIIRIPEIDDATESCTRTAVETAARECIAARTGIPIGYISVWFRD